MKLRELKGVDVLFYFVITYVLVAGGWWAYLLWIKNQDAMLAKQQVLWVQYQQQIGENAQYEAFLTTEPNRRLTRQYDRQNWMILGESVVLLSLIILGIWKIASSRQKEIALTRQQRNFLLSITHELKSPLAVIQLTLDTFNKRKLTPEQQSMLTKNGLSETERLKKLVEDLLLAARVDGGYQYSFEPIDLVDLSKKCIQIITPKFQGNIDFENQLDQATIKQGDPKTLSFVLLNLLENAVKYAQDGRKIIVRLLNSNEKNAYTIEVADFGKGIPKQEREQIFNKFYRVGNEDTRQTKGTGLGLYIAREIVKAHRGKIFVRGNQPKGSVFTITLPRA